MGKKEINAERKTAYKQALEGEVVYRGEKQTVHRRASRAGHLGRPAEGDPITGAAANAGKKVTDWGQHGGGGMGLDPRRRQTLQGTGKPGPAPPSLDAMHWEQASEGGVSDSQ